MNAISSDCRLLALRCSGKWAIWLVVALLFLSWCEQRETLAEIPGPRFEISFPASVHPESITGRVFLMMSRMNEPEVRVQCPDCQFFAIEAGAVKPGQTIVIDGSALGHPIEHLNDLPADEYYVQALFLVYTKYPRADGHIIWALDQWDGQDITQSPGTLYSRVQKLHIDPADRATTKVELSYQIALPPPDRDTVWIKHIKIKSELLSKFWGKPIYLGASVLVPKEYDQRRDLNYPIIYEQKSHYLRDEAFGFSTEDKSESVEERKTREALGYETPFQFYKSWNAEQFPKIIIARLINPTPYFDFSGVRNSPNIGPYQDAIMRELIPYIETRFRVIRQPYARILVGKSSGGRDALALQLLQPEFFGGAWIFHPWPFDYKRYFGVNIYQARNMFYVPQPESFPRMDENSPVWTKVPRILPFDLEREPLSTMQGLAHRELVYGGETNVGAELNGVDNALNSPIGSDGYPQHLYDMKTGMIDAVVAENWKEQGDLVEFARKNWSVIGRHLVGKLHISVGDADEWYRQYGVYEFQEFLETKDPYFGGTYVYGPRKGHMWQPMTNADLVRMIADYVARNAPPGANLTWKND